jgi:hypothetical protein
MVLYSILILQHPSNPIFIVIDPYCIAFIVYFVPGHVGVIVIVLETPFVRLVEMEKCNHYNVPPVVVLFIVPNELY